MKKRLSIVATLVLLQVNATALTLNEAVNEVINTNPEVVEKVKKYNSLRSVNEQSYSGYYPTIDIEGEIGYEEISNSSTGFVKKESDIDSARIVLKENIFNGFATQNLVDKSEAKLNSAKFDYLYNVNNKAYETIQNYIAILKNDAIISLSLGNIKVHEKILNDIKEKLDNNVGKISEHDRVAGRLAMANTQYIIKQNTLKEAVYIFHKLLGRFIRLEELKKPTFNEKLLPLALDGTIKTQLEFHPQLLSTQYDVKAKEYDYEMSKKEFYPIIDFEVSKAISHNMSGVDGKEDDFKAVVKARYNLYNGGYDEHEKQKRLSDIHLENEVKNRVKRTLLNDIQLSWSGYQVIEKQIPALRKNKYFMKKMLKAYKEEYKLGRRKLINILDAENEFYNAKVQLVEAEYNLLLQKFKILKAQGTLYRDLQASTFLENNDNTKELNTKDDELPLNYEVDGDKVLDEVDICVNSKKDLVVGKSGCDKKSDNDYVNILLKTKKTKMIKSSSIKNNEDLLANKIDKNKITVLDYLTYKEGSVELSGKSTKMMRTILTQLKKVSPNSTIEIRVNSNESANVAENTVLSTQRGYALKKIFLINNVESNGINIFTIVDAKKTKLLNNLELLVAQDLESVDLNYEKIEDAEVYFDEKSVKLTTKAKAKLRKIASKLKASSKRNVDIITYAKEYVRSIQNDEISQKRAELIKKFLQKEGVVDVTLTPFGMGKYHQDLLFDIVDIQDFKSNIVEFVIK
ncbi:MAG: TolC family outer membrane protein [Campylobacterota bacterium]|nr:TolC family outer membrane protein [Campylobacterota bacterium]